MSQLIEPTTAPSPAEPVAKHKQSIIGAILPFIGVALFVIVTIGQFAGNPGDNWGPTHVNNAVTYLIGSGMLGAGIAHVFFGRRISKTIGFANSPYELEVGFADIAFGVVALLASHFSMEFSLSIILASSIYRVGCGIGHIRSMIQDRNFAPNNTAILAVNFLVPAFVIFAYYAWA
jgi:phosphate/sulfate permease